MSEAIWEIIKQILGMFYLIRDTLAPNHLNISSRQARRTAELVSRTTHLRYKLLKANANILNAFAVETLGPWLDDVLNLINNYCPKLNQFSGDLRSHEYLCQRISLDIQRGKFHRFLQLYRPQNVSMKFFTFEFS